MKTSQHQFDLLVMYMEEHGDLSKPSSNARGSMATMQNWEELAPLLNRDDSGETKTTEKWKKFWYINIYFVERCGGIIKNKVKKKAARLHIAARGIGGGLAVYSKLHYMDQRVLNIIGGQAATGLEIAEAGFLQEMFAVPSKQPEHDTHQKEMDGIKQALNEPGLSTQVETLCKPGPSSQVHTEAWSLSEAYSGRTPSQLGGELRPPSQAHMEPMKSPSYQANINWSPPRPVVSPAFIHLHEEPIENTEDLNTETPALSHVAASLSSTQPALFGQTTPRRNMRSSQV